MQSKTAAQVLLLGTDTYDDLSDRVNRLEAELDAAKACHADKRAIVSRPVFSYFTYFYYLFILYEPLDCLRFGVGEWHEFYRIIS